MRTQALTSIVMPCLNAEPTIGEAITSVLGQRDAAFELIVMDGGSRDGTLERCRAFGDPRIRIFSGTDRGVAEALNRGFALARGTALCWLNADDVYLNARAVALAARTMASRHAGAVVGHSALLDRHGVVKRTLYTWTTNLEHARRGANLFTGSLFFSRDIWRRFGGFDVSLKVAFEYELSDFLFRSSPPVLADEVLAGLRCHAGSLTERFPERMVEELARIRPSVPAGKPERTHRLLAHGRDRTLGRVLLNALRDRYAGQSWRSLFVRSAHQQLR
jgi:glycosyltransferase involved in cell wall biosynthesis